MSTDIQISITGNLLMYKKGYTPDFIEKKIEEKKLNGLFVFDHLDPLPNVDFLYKCSFLKGLAVTMVHDYGFKFLKELQNLNYLSINTYGNSIIDLQYQMNLEHLSITWRREKIMGLENCKNLKTLVLIEYKEQDLIAISALYNLEELTIKTASIKTLNGIKNLTSLQSIFLGNCKSLTTVEELVDLPNLKKVQIDTCRNINNIRLLKSIRTLEQVKIWPKSTDGKST